MVAMRVDEAGQDELARGVNDSVVRPPLWRRAVGRTRASNPVSLDDDERVWDRVAARPVDQIPVFDNQARRGIAHCGHLPMVTVAMLGHSRLVRRDPLWFAALW